MSTDLQRHRLGLTWVERGGMVRTSHALRDGARVWLIDPFEHEAALAVAAELGAPAGVVQLLDRHNRDCEELAERLGVPHHRVPFDGLPGSPFRVLPIVRNRLWNEVALWWEAESALIVAEAVGTAPLFALGRRAGIHPLLRPLPPRSRFDAVRGRPAMLLVGHGRTLPEAGADALDEALAHARGDLPRLVLSIPKVVRGG